MTTKIILWILFYAVFFGLLSVWALTPTTTEGQTAVVYVDKPSLSPSQIIWIARLMDCESGINHEAINPNDLDNTPSWGILQFKPSTFESFTVKYGIESDLMNPEAQVQIVTYWILNPGEVRWSQQFPACIRKIGEPPTNNPPLGRV